jgi:peptide/nickel transport system substrate-binding protein
MSVSRAVKAVIRLTAAALVVAGAMLWPAADAGAQALVVGANFVVKSLDPARTVETTSNMVNHSIYDSLVTFDGEDLTTPKPSLATDWTVSPDGKTYTFRLRRNVRFAGGNPMTSADVKWSFDRVRFVKSNPAFFLNSVEDILTPDPYTVVLKLKAPNPSLLPILSSSSLGVIDSKLVSQKGGDASPDAKDKDKAEPFLLAQSAGTGAYVLERYVPDQEIVLARNPNHWRGAPKLERIVIRNITEPAAQKLQLERGDLDIATGLDQDQMRALRSSPGVTAKASPAATTFYVLMNADPQIGGPFANPKVQQAVRYALDYEGILALAGPGAVRLAGVIPVVFPGAMDPRQGARTDQERAGRSKGSEPRRSRAPSPTRATRPSSASR